MPDWSVEGRKQPVGNANGTGVQLLPEDVPVTHLPTALDMKNTAALIGPEVGVSLDCCNSACIEQDQAPTTRMLGDLVKNVHISDSGYDEFPRAGTGVVEPGPAAAALRDIGHSGVTVLEIMTDALQPGAGPDADIRPGHAILRENGLSPLG